MTAGKVSKRTKKRGHGKCEKNSRNQADKDLGKLQSLDHAIQEHQKAQFYGTSDAQLDHKPVAKASKNERTLKGLQNLLNVDSRSSLSRKIRRSQDLRALDSVLETLSKMDFANSQRDSEHPKPAIVEDAEIDV